ncbi:MAG: thioredoxin domain-containing protein [Thermodesulfobacteriota bacterium]
MTRMETGEHNRLIDEKSPYLIQHADNPVDWYPWGDEAFEKAKKEKKPVLVSIGYATCHWCHVMADESFSDPETAKLMNRDLVNIKLDREERPDLDQIYITAVSALTGSAGWPLNVFLTPDAKPFYGGTYFPPQNRLGMPSWKEVVEAVAAAWKDEKERKKLLDSAESITAAVKNHLNGGQSPGIPGVPGADVIDDAAEGFFSSYDKTSGGFSRAPKFPMPPVLGFLLFYHKYRGGDDAGEKALEMAVHTMRRMEKGGIYDHVGGGFHRYSTDERWHVPHFEKMLYDNAQLISLYLSAYNLTGEESFARTARNSLDYVFREMTHPGGGFYSAQDADSPEFVLSGTGESQAGGRKVEGAFYVWRKQEIESALDADSAGIFSYHYDVRPKGNAETDPFGEFEGKNILHETGSIEQTAGHFGRSPGEIQKILDSALGKLLEARNRRPAPHVDDKILTEWNALMISALAKAGRILGDDKYISAGRRAIDFINSELINENGALFRRWRDGHFAVPGLAGDYSFFVRSLLDMHEAVGDSKYLTQAEELGRRMLDGFYDSENGGFFMTASGHDPNLIIRAKDFTDGVQPAAASAAAMNCIDLFRLTGDRLFSDAAARSFSAAAERIKRQPQSAPHLIEALGFFQYIKNKMED